MISKYRAWHTKDKEMRGVKAPENCEIQWLFKNNEEGEWYCILYNLKANAGVTLVSNVNGILMDYTENTDVMNEPIYDCDMVQFVAGENLGCIGLISESHTGAWCVTLYDKEDTGDIMLWDVCKEVKIIGNIFEKESKTVSG